MDLSCWIRIQEEKYPTKKEKSKEIHVLNCWVFSFEGGRLLLYVAWSSFIEA
jgi:hypothetical protein